MSLLISSNSSFNCFGLSKYQNIVGKYTLAADQDRIARERLAFLFVSKARTSTFYVFPQCAYIV